MVQLRKRLAKFIRQKRGRMGQREFARKTGLAQSTIMRIENMEQNVTLDTLEQLCRVYHVEIEELFPVILTPRVYGGREFAAAGIHDSAAASGAGDKAAGSKAQQAKSVKTPKSANKGGGSS